MWAITSHCITLELQCQKWLQYLYILNNYYFLELPICDWDNQHCWLYTSWGNDRHRTQSILIKALNNEHKRKITMEIILPEQLVPVKWVLRSKTKLKKSVRLIILNQNTCKILRQIFKSPWRLSNDLIMLQYVVFGKLTNQSDWIFFKWWQTMPEKSSKTTWWGDLHTWMMA